MIGDRLVTSLRKFSAESRWAVTAVSAVVTTLLVIAGVCLVNALAWVDRPFPGFLLNERLAVATVGEYGWSGVQAGLTFPDRIKAVNGAEVRSAEEVFAFAASQPVGTSVAYQVRRGDESLTVTVPTMRFTWGDLLATFGILYLVGFAYLAIGLVVLTLKFNTKVSWVFFGATALLALYSVTNFDISSTHFGFISVYLLVNAFLPASFIQFGMNFPRSRSPDALRWGEAVPYVIALGIAAPMIYLYPDERFVRFWNLALAYMIVGAVFLLVPFVRELFRQSSGIARQRAKIVLLGAAIGFPIPAVTWTCQAVFGSFLGVRMQGNYLSIPLLVFPASIAYAIIRHNLFDVDVYLKRALGYVIMIVVVAVTYFGVQTATVTLVLEPWIGGAARQVYPIAFALLVVLFYNPVHARVQRGVERLFFRSKADYRGTVSAVREVLSRLAGREEIVDRMIETIRGEMSVDAVGLFTHDPRTETCRYVLVEDRPPQEGGTRRREGTLPCDDPLYTLMSSERRMITAYDVSEDPRFVDVRETCAKTFQDLGASLLIPLMAHGEVTGALSAGLKKSGSFYTGEDIDLLATLASQGAVALENARLAEEMKEEQQQRAGLARHLSPEVVERIMRGGRELDQEGGERKEVTVLISDIRDFTHITETRRADHLVELLNEYFTEMADVIFAHSGSLDKYVGDAVVAVFGSLVEVERPARNAVEAAIEMMRRMPLLNAGWQDRFGFTVQIGIGVATGEVFLGNVGSPERMEFTVIGDAVNVASRLASQKPGGRILIARTTAEQAGVPCDALQPVRLRGKGEDVEIFEVAAGPRAAAPVEPGTGNPPSKSPVPGGPGGRLP
jgi:class 3 adenylate cyclase